MIWGNHTQNQNQVTAQADYRGQPQNQRGQTSFMNTTNPSSRSQAASAPGRYGQGGNQGRGFAANTYSQNMFQQNTMPGRQSDAGFSNQGRGPQRGGQNGNAAGLHASAQAQMPRPSKVTGPNPFLSRMNQNMPPGAQRPSQNQQSQRRGAGANPYQNQARQYGQANMQQGQMIGRNFNMFQNQGNQNVIQGFPQGQPNQGRGMSPGFGHNQPNSGQFPNGQPNQAPQGNRQAMPQGLPDGVRYEPISEEMMEQWRKITPPPVNGDGETGGTVNAGKEEAHHSHNREPSKPADGQNLNAVQMPEATPPALPLGPAALSSPHTAPAYSLENMSRLSDRLSVHMQNLHNTSVFYGRLAEAATSQPARATLQRLSAENVSAREACNQIYKSYKGEDCVTQDRPLEQAGYVEGIRLALTEGANCLYELSDIYEEIPDYINGKTISTLITKKIAEMILLNGLK